MNAAQEDILVEVRNAWETIAAQRKNVEAALVSRRLSADRLATEKAKNVDDTASLDVLRDQRDLADAQVRELQALVDYQLAKVAYEKAMNSLVDDEQIVLARRK
jgi:outer membrane protein TolC